MVQGRGEMEMDMIHVYDPRENQIFLQENTVFSWYHNETLKEAGKQIKLNLIKFIYFMVRLKHFQIKATTKYA